jgi:hypothetical protein
MNAPAIFILGAFVLMWLGYLASPRTSSFLFALWFPLTATAGIGTFLWLGSVLGVGSSGPAQGEGQGWAAYGRALEIGILLICPIVLAFSVWLRPPRSACRAIVIIPTVVVYFGLLWGAYAASYHIEKKILVVSVLDEKGIPVAGAKMKYETLASGDGLPGASFKGEAVTDSSGVAAIPTGKKQKLFCVVAKEGFDKLQLIEDRCWGNFTEHQTSVQWFGADGNVDGTVQLNVPDGVKMSLTVYLPHTGSAEKLPYPPWAPGR